MNEKTLFLVKPNPPDSRVPWLKHAESVIERLQALVPDARVLHERDLTLTERQVSDLYREALPRLRARQSPQYAERMITYMTSGPVRILLLEGPGVCEKVRTAVGSTDSAMAVEGSIRNVFGRRLPSPMFMNSAHASDSPNEASREMFILDPIAWIEHFYE